MGIFLAYSWAQPQGRLKKSDIECVILAGSSLFKSVREITMLVVHRVVFGARSARFFKDFDVIAPKNPKISLVPIAHGHHGTVMGIFLAPPEPNPCPYS
jgi:hypothetical protein